MMCQSTQAMIRLPPHSIGLRLRGTAMVELLIVLPVLLMFLVLSMDVARALHARITLIGAVGESAVAGARELAGGYSLENDGSLKDNMERVADDVFGTQYGSASFEAQLLCRCQGDTNKLVCINNSSYVTNCGALQVYAQMKGTLSFPLIIKLSWLPTTLTIQTSAIMRGR